MNSKPFPGSVAATVFFMGCVSAPREIATLHEKTQNVMQIAFKQSMGWDCDPSKDFTLFHKDLAAERGAPGQ